MEYKKHLEQDGAFAGLWVRTARTLRRAGYTSKGQVQVDLASGKLQAFISGVKGYGLYAHEETWAWTFKQEGNAPREQRDSRVIPHS